MGLLRMRMDALHYALLAVVVLLAVYCGASFFREVETAKDSHDEQGRVSAFSVGRSPLLPEHDSHFKSG